MITFGKTWWGEKWLSALEHIDYSNRLPRGRVYARNGSVKGITIKENQIHSKVQGSRRAPYQVSLVIPEFRLEHKKLLLGAILKSPLTLSRLLNRELPNELDRIALDAGIRIFPSSWKDLSMECSCPDWAVPCKHLAAVIYIISSEIDKNPFLIFQLHGLDIVKELEKSGFTGQADLHIPKASDRLLKNPEKNPPTPIEPKAPDFSRIPFLADDLLSLLDEKPLFYSRDFRQEIKQHYKSAIKNTKDLLESGTPMEADISELERYSEVELILHDDILFDNIVFRYEEEEMDFANYQGLNKMVSLIAEIPSKYVSRLSPGVVSLYYTYQFCLKVLEQGAFIPQLTEMTGERYIIRWIPATINEEVEKTILELKEIIPPGMVIVRNSAADDMFLSNYDQVMAISGLMLNFLLIPSIPIKRYDPIPKDTKVERLFFGRSVQTFNGLGEAEIPGSIFQWLSGYYLVHKTFVPLIRVDALKNNRFQLDLLLENRKETLQEPVIFSSFMHEEKYSDMRAAVLHSLSRLVRDFKDIGTFIESYGKWKPDYGPDEFAEVLIKVLPVIRLLGIRILLPNALKNLVRPRLSLILDQKSSGMTKKSFLNLEEMLAFDWQIALGDQMISLYEFEKLTKGLSGIVSIKGSYVLIDRAEIQQMLNSMSSDRELSSNDLLKAALTEEYREAKITISGKAHDMIMSLLQEPNLELPRNLNALLRPYQLRGWQWLYRNANAGFGSIIADDMGLGKTLQVITMLLRFKEEDRFKNHPALIVVPTTLIANWQKEIERFAESLSLFVYHGQGRRFSDNGYDLLITSYGILRSDIEIFQKRKWSVVIIDEVQNIKNPHTEQTKAVKKLKAPVRIAMSGTPVENRLSEYWSIFDFINKGYLGSLKFFKEEIATPIEMFRDEKQLEKFRKITSPFILRRMKTDKTIIDDLPEKIENDRYVSLTKEQTAIYQNVVESMISGIEDEESGSFKRAGMIFKLMTALKQVCNHPSQFLKKEDPNPQLSGKAMMLLELLQTIYENDEKVLIFTQYKEMGDILAKMIEHHFGNRTLFLHGSTTLKVRNELVIDFQEKRQYKTFILSIKAGGTGLNLTAANHVIHYDLWWNPAVEAQATDRAFRIGQHKNVMVYRLISRGTFEEKINEMLISKKDLANLTVTAGEKWIGELSDKEFGELVRL
jgi:SNF2 family DNA or RNA helicase/uncharacterized Zn finger protein